MTQRIHQILPTISPHDAIGNEAILIQNTLTKMGYDSQIFAENIHTSMSNVKSINDYNNSNKNDIFIYHHSIGSGLLDFILSLKCKIIMIYHNITPPEFFDGTNSTIADLLRLGRKQLEILKNKISLAAGDSEFNRLELEKIGYENTTVLPILLDFSKYLIQPDQSLISRYRDYINILYVGRIAPNKRVDDVIRSFAYFNQNINPKSNLFIVGRSNGIADRYLDSLQSLIENAQIKNVHLVTDADDKKLVNFYQIANLFVTMSLHEGFCVPLVESMYFKIPIIAHNSSAIPYTLGDSGITVKDETYEEIGELFDFILLHPELKKIIEKQTNRFHSIYAKDNESMISDLLHLIK
ncbi:MAG: glycosyltransferase family 4 protein [Thaumarchaeota archaeon]|nr:glycosyltransferase family 4 protein [Nitrososphaerota archaeon]